MAKICQLSGAKPSTGHNVSHSVRRTKRRFLPNLQWKRVFDPLTKTMVRVRITARTLRTLNKPLSKREEARLERKVAAEMKAE